MIKIDVKGVEEAKEKLRKTARRIDKAEEDTLKEVGELGFEFALNLAPEFTGELKKAMLSFRENKESWVIVSKQPAGDTIPINVMFDEGTYPKPRRSSSIGFMKQTKQFLEREFSQKLNLAIERAVV